MATLSQQEVEQWIAQHGGAQAVQYGVEQKQVRNPSPDIAQQTLYPYVPIEVQVWKNPKTGAALTVRRNDDGDFEQIENVGADPNKAAGQAPPGGKPFYDDPESVGQAGRRWGWNPESGAYDVNLGPSPTAQGSQTATASVPVEGYPGWTQKTVKVGNDQKTVFINPQGQEAADPRPAARAPNKYVQTHQDPDSKKWYGLTPDGKWEPIEGGPGAEAAAQSGGPNIPQMIYGHTEEAIRAYEAQLNAEVKAGTMTPAERSKRMTEAMNMATHVVNEATVMQREQESTRAASANLAAGRMQAATTGMGQALSFVQNLNADLPEHSPLGGKALAAILGLQMANAQRMGAYPSDLTQRPQSSEGRAIANATSETIGTATQRLGELARPPAPAPVPPAPPADIPGVRTGAAMTGTGVDAPVIPPPVAAPVAPVAPAPTPGEPGGPPLQTTYPPFQPPTVPTPSALPPADEFGRTPAAPALLPPDTDYAPYNGDPSQGPVGMVPSSQPAASYAVLARGPTAPSPLAVPPVGNPPPDYAVMPYAQMHARAASVPPWRLDPAEIERMAALGVPESVIYGVPGRA
jgi:hypothetical protein